MKKLFTFDGGLNTDSPLSIMPENQQEIQRNLRYFQGALTYTGAGSAVTAQSGGTSTFNDPIRGFTTWADNSTQPQLMGLVVVAGATIYATDWVSDSVGVLSFVDRTGAVTVTTGTTRTFDSLNNILMGFGGNGDAAFKITATGSNAASLGGSPPTAEIVKVVNNFAFVALDLNTPNYSRVWWSNVGDPETWGASNFVDFRKNDGDAISALGAIGTDLYIFKLNSIGKLYTVPTSGSSLGPLVTVSVNVGCLNRFCVDNLPDGSLVFLGSDLVLYRFDGVSLENLSELPYPGPSVKSYLLANELESTPDSLDFVDPKTSLKVDHMNREIIISSNDLNLDNDEDDLLNIFVVYNWTTKTWHTEFSISSTVVRIFSELPPYRPGPERLKPKLLLYSSSRNGSTSVLVKR